jgi:hypothetical protein
VDRSNCAEAALHLHRSRVTHRDVRLAGRFAGADRCFPNINIPVISVVWNYTGLLPNDMSGRVIYYYERTLTSQVGGIEHIESQSLNSYGVVKIFFQKGVDILPRWRRSRLPRSWC